MTAVFKPDEVLFAVLMNGDFQPLRKRVDDAGADTVQTTGHLIGTAAELTAGVQDRHDRLYR